MRAEPVFWPITETALLCRFCDWSLTYSGVYYHGTPSGDAFYRGVERLLAEHFCSHALPFAEERFAKAS